MNKFLQLVQHPLKFRMFLLSKLPSAYFSGLRVHYANEKKCIVTIPYKWFSQNPFKSTYFACLSMAAEMSTGILAMAHVYKRDPPISMLVLKVDSNYLKKAVGQTRFECRDGILIKQTIDDAVISGEGKIITARSTGRNKEGEVVADFLITWSFKEKRKV